MAAWTNISTLAYALFAEGSAASRSPVARFRTAPSPDAGGTVVFGATSCLGPANRPWPSLAQAAAAELDFFALLGDTVYADGSRTLSEYRGVWHSALQVAGLRQLAAATSVIGVWDDHEIDNDWSTNSTTAAQRSAARLAFFEAIPKRGKLDDALYYRTRYGPVDVFALDCRSERVPEKGQYISQKQMDWLKDNLVSSTAPFKVILNSVPVSCCLCFAFCAG